MISSDMISATVDDSLNEESLMTYALAYREGVSLLSNAGMSNAANETLWLMEMVLGISSLDLYTKPDTGIPESSWLRATKVLLRRAEGEPLQYILGTQMFRGLDMAVQPGVLIPRPESELIIEEVHSVQVHGKELHMADVGTGSGCLAIALAAEFPHATIYATDCSHTVIEAAASNAKRHKVQDRIHFLCGDLLEPLNLFPELHASLSIMVANPPYIPTGQIGTLSKDVRDFEPHLALDGGPDGLLFYRRLLREAPLYVQRGGHLVIEMGEGQAQSICKEAEGLSAWCINNIRKDDAGLDRVMCLERRG